MSPALYRSAADSAAQEGLQYHPGGVAALPHAAPFTRQSCRQARSTRNSFACPRACWQRLVTGHSDWAQHARKRLQLTGGGPARDRQGQPLPFLCAPPMQQRGQLQWGHRQLAVPPRYQLHPCSDRQCAYQQRTRACVGEPAHVHSASGGLTPDQQDDPSRPHAPQATRNSERPVQKNMHVSTGRAPARPASWACLASWQVPLRGL